MVLCLPASPGRNSKKGARESVLPSGLPVHTAALRQVRPMRGGSCPHLVRCSDGYLYVVKFPNNPQGRRSLACEMLGTLLATHLGLPTQTPAVVEASQDFVANSPQQTIATPDGSVRCAEGREVLRLEVSFDNPSNSVAPGCACHRFSAGFPGGPRATAFGLRGDPDLRPMDVQHRCAPTAVHEIYRRL